MDMIFAQVGGINENAEEDNLGPEIELFMNDESFINGGITNENPNLIVKLLTRMELIPQVELVMIL